MNTTHSDIRDRSVKVGTLFTRDARGSAQQQEAQVAVVGLQDQVFVTRDSSEMAIAIVSSDNTPSMNLP